MELTRTPDVEVFPYRFVPEGFDPADVPALESLAKELLKRPLEDSDALRQWIYDWSEIASVVWGEWCRRLIAMNRNTGAAELKQAYLDFDGDVKSAWTRLEDQCNRKYLACPVRSLLGDEFAVFDKTKQTAADIFREKNVDIATEVNRIAAEWQELQGAHQIEFRGETLTQQQLAVHLQSTDRATREEAFRASMERRLEDRAAIDKILDGLVRRRHRMAVNAGFENYIGFRFAQLSRFDYTADDCAGYHAAVEAVVKPALEELHEERRRRLGVDTVRPYDLSVSLSGADPKPLFDTQEEFVGLTQKIFGAVDPVFHGAFDVLVRNDLLDLMSRPGKAPGGYNCGIDDMRLPFIFYNAVGNRRDLRVLLHEGGHAFHTLAARDIPVALYRSAPAEFCEVASMSMELFGVERIGDAVDEAEAREIRLAQFEGVLSGLAQVALIDAFQAWFYANPKHSHEERDAKWGELRRRFQPEVDWSGLEDTQVCMWQRIPHFFTHPLYYIEYGIAQIGALQLWKLEKRDHAQAVAGYRKALALGGSRRLPQLFEAAGIRFAMDEQILRELVPDVQHELRSLLAFQADGPER